MQIIFYLFVTLTAFYTGSIRNRLLFSRTGAPISAPLAILTAAGATVLCYLFFKVYLLFFMLLLALLRKFRMSLGGKIALLAGIVAGITAAMAAGPVGWTVLAIAAIISALLLLPQIEETAADLYMIFIREMIRVFCAARKTADKARSVLPNSLRFLVALAEIPAVCGLAIAGMWELINWLYEPYVMTGSMYLLHLSATLPLAVVLYRYYLRDTAFMSRIEPKTSVIDLTRSVMHMQQRQVHHH